jgi:hypothetical protein
MDVKSLVCDSSMGAWRLGRRNAPHHVCVLLIRGVSLLTVPPYEYSEILTPHAFNSPPSFPLHSHS